jgi:hypothetical protein
MPEGVNICFYGPELSGIEDFDGGIRSRLFRKAYTANLAREIRTLTPLSFQTAGGGTVWRYRPLARQSSRRWAMKALTPWSSAAPSPST